MFTPDTRFVSNKKSWKKGQIKYEAKEHWEIKIQYPRGIQWSLHFEFYFSFKDRKILQSLLKLKIVTIQELMRWKGGELVCTVMVKILTSYKQMYSMSIKEHKSISPTLHIFHISKGHNSFLKFEYPPLYNLTEILLILTFCISFIKIWQEYACTVYLCQRENKPIKE